MKAGQSFQTEMPPSPMNCPMPTSRKNIGTPPVTRQMTYGIRNAPEKGDEGRRTCGSETRNVGKGSGAARNVYSDGISIVWLK